MLQLHWVTKVDIENVHHSTFLYIETEKTVIYKYLKENILKPAQS